MSARRRRAIFVVVIAALALGMLPQGGAAATTRSTVSLGPGVGLTRTSFTLRAGSAHLSERSVFVRATLSAHTSLVAAAPHDMIGAPRSTVLAMAREQHALAGVNGDVFYLSDPTAVPRGGVTWNGRILKSTLAGKQASLYVDSRGIAAIGDPHFVASVRTATGHTHGLATMNSLENARNGGTTLLDPSVASRAMPHCALSVLTPRAGGGWTVAGTRTGVTRFQRLAAGNRALMSCSAANARWFPSVLTRGLAVTLTAGYSVPHLTTVLSGPRVLVLRGKRYTDRTGLLGYGNQRKPESFACVLRGGRTVLFGAVEGDRRGVAGMTYGQLSGYLLGLGCWQAMALDGSASSTVVARTPGHALTVQNHTTDKGGPRKVVDGLFVVRR